MNTLSSKMKEIINYLKGMFSFKTPLNSQSDYKISGTSSGNKQGRFIETQGHKVGNREEKKKTRTRCALKGFTVFGG